MRKNFYLMAAMAVSTMMITSCSQSDDVNEVAAADVQPLELNSVGVASANTRAGITAAAFSGSEQVGLYIYRGTGIGDSNKAYNEKTSTISTTNVPYAYSNSKWTATQPIILSNVVGKVYSYYPYSASYTGDGTTVPVTVASSQGTGQSDGTADVTEQKDYMYGTVVENISNKANSVSITMKHALVMATFKFANSTTATDKYPGEGKVSKIVLKNKSGVSILKTGNGTMNISTGAITASTTDGTITLTPGSTETLMDVTTASKLPRLLMFPTGATAAGDIQASVTVDGATYTVNLPAQTDGYKAGNNYVFNLELKGTSLEVSKVAITQWVDKDQAKVEVKTPDA